MARKQYRVLKARNYPVTILGGGARGLHHFTEFVGADTRITINWKGTADTLIKENPPVIDRFSMPISEKIVEELLEKVPLFKTSWLENGLPVKEYGNYPPVILFRNMFLNGWRLLKTKIGDIRYDK